MCIMIVNFKQLSLSFVTRQCHVHFSLNFRRMRKNLSLGKTAKFPNSPCVASLKIERNAKRFDRRHVAAGAMKGEDAKMIGERRGP